MADKDDKTIDGQVTDIPDSTTPAPEAKTVNVENVEPAPPPLGAEPTIVVTKGDTPRQMIGEPRDVSPLQPVREHFQKLDRVILDTSDPLAVQPGPKDTEFEPDPRTPEQKITEELKK